MRKIVFITILFLAEITGIKAQSILVEAESFANKGC